MMRNIVVILFFCAGMLACSKPREIPDDKLRAIVHDIYIANAYGITVMRGNGTDTIDIYSSVFKKYGYKPGDLIYTIENMSRRKSVGFTEVLDSVITIIRKEGNYYDSLVTARDTSDQRLIRKYGEVVYLSDSTRKVTRARDLDKMEVTLPARKGMYETEFIAFVDSTDKNSAVQFHFYAVDTVTGRETAHNYHGYAKGIRRKEVVKSTVTQDNLEEVRLDFARVVNSDPQTTNVTIDSIKVTFLPTVEVARDSLIRDISRLGGLDRYMSPHKKESDGQSGKTPIVPFHPDTAGAAARRDSVVRP